MATSDIGIANRALTKIGAARIISFGDNNEAARALQSMYAIVRDAEIRAYSWSFAIKRVSLAALAQAPEFDYDRQFQLPSDCLKVLWAGDFYPGPNMSDLTNALEQDYAVEGSIIMSRLPAPLKVRYLARIEDPTKFDALFVEAFACKLAVELGETITNSSTNRQEAWQEYERAIRKAVRANAIEKPSQAIADDTWMIARWI